MVCFERIDISFPVAYWLIGLLVCGWDYLAAETFVVLRVTVWNLVVFVTDLATRVVTWHRFRLHIVTFLTSWLDLLTITRLLRDWFFFLFLQWAVVRLVSAFVFYLCRVGFFFARECFLLSTLGALVVKVDVMVVQLFHAEFASGHKYFQGFLVLGLV